MRSEKHLWIISIFKESAYWKILLDWVGFQQIFYRYHDLKSNAQCGRNKQLGL